jgi:DNA replication and repair protein RecF
MPVVTLWLTDFRCFNDVTFEPDPNGLTVLRGSNGAGKTSILEAVGWLAMQKSLRGSPREALVRTGAERAVVRAETTSNGRDVLIEADIPLNGVNRIMVNRQPVRRRTDLGGALRVTVFSPEDLHLVQGGPAGRRDLLDDVLLDRHPRWDAVIGEVSKVLRQRAALLRQIRGRLDADSALTLDVWDNRLVQAGAELADAREALCEELTPLVSAAYRRLAAGTEEVRLNYHRSWSGSLADAVAAARPEDVRRQASSCGPHRDDLDISLAGRPVRTQASQGEQRCVVLALRLATHRLRHEETGEPPLLLLDDVFSELDAKRSTTLIEELPAGQVLLTTALDPPAAVGPGRVVEVSSGTLRPSAARS